MAMKKSTNAVKAKSTATRAKRVCKPQLDEKAGKEYDIFNKHQPIISDFDQEIKRLLGRDEK